MEAVDAGQDACVHGFFSVSLGNTAAEFFFGASLYL